MPLSLVYPANSLTGGYEVANSCRFTRGDSPYMHITPGSDGDLRKFTVAFWCKRGLLTTGSGTGRQVIFSTATNDAITFDGSTDKLVILEDGGNALVTERLFRDCSAWYHVCVAVDTEQGVAANRIKLYINGTLITDFSTTCQTSQNADMGFGKASEMMSVGRSEFDDNRHFDGYLAEFYYINDAQLAASDFGEFDEDSPSIFKPKEFEGSFGTNGFYLDFEDSANLGNDANGGTDLTEVNLAAADQATDTPTNNFCTLNPLDIASAAITLSEGNCKMVGSGTADDKDVFSTFGITAGKWYWEVKTRSVGERNWLIVSDQGESGYKFTATNYGTNHAYLRAFDGGIVTSATENSEPGSALNDNDVACFAFDADNGQLWVSDSANIDISTTANATGLSTSTTYHISYSHVGNSPGSTNEFNFGNPVSALTSANADENGYGAFEYAPPSGYLALCTKNLGSDGG